MKRIRPYIITLLTLISVFSGCSRPTTIKDGDLKAIFKEIYLTNAYIEQYRSHAMSLHMDSLDMYRPLLAEYGYTVNDLRYTINTFSTRKSYRLSDVVDEVIQDLQDGVDWYKYIVGANDSIDARALRMFRRQVYEDSVITAKTVRDTANLRLTIPVMEGTYEVSYGYFIDSLDKNKNFRTTILLTDDRGKTRNVHSNTMIVAREGTHRNSITTTDADTAMTVLFGNYPKEDLKRPDIRIDTLRIFYSPPLHIARDSAAIVTYRYKLLLDEREKGQPAQDSVALPVHPEGIPEERDTDD